MRRNVLFVTAIFLAFVLATYAQTSSSSQSSSSGTALQSGASASGNSNSAEQNSSAMQDNSVEQNGNLEGCVVRQETDYFIQPVSGARVHLNGGDQDLSNYVGQEVRISGHWNPYDQNGENSAQASTQPSGAPVTGPVGTGKASDQTGRIFLVTRVDKVSDTCPTSTPGNNSNPQ